jgi:hypothetical protein
MNIKQQAEYVEIIKAMHLKVERLWGEGSKQEIAMKEILEKEGDKLSFIMLQDFSSPIESEDDPFCGWKTAKLFMSPENLRDIKGWDAKKD